MPSPPAGRPSRPRSGLFLEVPLRSSPSTPDLNGNEWKWPTSRSSHRQPRSRSQSGGSSGSSGQVSQAEIQGVDMDAVTGTEASGYGYEDESDVPLAASPTCSVDHSGQGREMVNVTLPCDVDTLFALLFGGSAFFEEFHVSRKTFDIKQSDWESASPEGSESEGRKFRKVSFTVTLTQPLGPKHSYLSESQTLLPESKRGHLYAVDTEVNNAGIPYADSFFVTTHYCLSRALAGVRQRHSRLIILCELHFRKSVFRLTKRFIEGGTWDGMTEFYGHLERALKQECVKPDYATPLAPLSRVGSMRRSSRRPRSHRKSYKAPPVPSEGPQMPRRLSLASNGRRWSVSASIAPSGAPGSRLSSLGSILTAPWRWLTTNSRAKSPFWSMPVPSMHSIQFSYSVDVNPQFLMKTLVICMTIALVLLELLIYVKINELEATLDQRRTQYLSLSATLSQFGEFGEQQTFHQPRDAENIDAVMRRTK